MDVKPFELEDPTDVVQVVLRVKEELPDVKDLLYEPPEMEHSTEFVPVLGIKEELPDVKDELIQVHDVEICAAHIMDDCNTDNGNIRLEFRSDVDPLSIVEKQSRCDSPGKASWNYRSSESMLLEVTKRELYCKPRTSKIKDLNNSALDNEANPANFVTEVGKIGLNTVRNVGERKYICDECGKCFTVRRSFVAHLLIHSGERKHKCEQCGKCFIESGHLVIHSLIHSGEKKHKCEECGKCFNQRGNLARHSLIHCGERKHKCEDCEKCFSNRGDLVRHSLIHSGERKHKCQECGKCFNQHGNLIRHSIIHSGERKFKCDECGKSFPSRKTIISHLLIHPVKEKHKCH